MFRNRRQSTGGPIVSATYAPRSPIGKGAPVVVSRAVWCSNSAFSSAPTINAMTEIQVQTMKPINAPNAP